MVGRRAIVVAASIALLASLAACGGSSEGPDRLTVQGAWARATPAGATNGAVYLTVTSPTTDRLQGVTVSSRVAGAAELHESMGADGGGSMANMPNMDDGGSSGQMVMKPLRSVALPAGDAVVFEPGGRHIMLTDLVRGLEPGDRFVLVLRFAHAPDRTVPVVVRTNPPA